MLRRPLTSLWMYLLLLILIIGFALLPLIGAIGASAIGSMADCRVDEAGSYPCIILGTDIGGALSLFFVMGWLMFATMPIAGVLFVVWLVVAAIHALRRRSRHR